MPVTKLQQRHGVPLPAFHQRLVPAPVFRARVRVRVSALVIPVDESTSRVKRGLKVMASHGLVAVVLVVVALVQVCNQVRPRDWCTAV